MTEKLLRIPEVATFLDIPTDCAYKMAREGILPVVRVGRQVRVDPAVLQEWIRNGGQSYDGGWRKELATVN